MLRTRTQTKRSSNKTGKNNDLKKEPHLLLDVDKQIINVDKKGGLHKNVLTGIEKGNK